MNERQLDDALGEMIAPLPAQTAHEAQRLATASRPQPRPTRSRLLWLLPALALGGGLLTAGITATAAQLSVWPWVELPAGSLRTTEPIPVEWVNDDGAEESCRAYLELENASDADIEALDGAILARDWSRFGQELYDQGTPEAGDFNGQSRVGVQLDRALAAFAQATIPGLDPLTSPNFDAATAPRIGATGMSCRSDNP